MQKYSNLCFINYTKAFDRVKDEVLQQLQSLDTDVKDLRLLCNLYWEQTAWTRVDNDLRSFRKIRKVCLRMCVKLHLLD